jgi:hypothetical protein
MHQDNDSIRTNRRKEFIRLIDVGLQKDYVWHEFVGDWNEDDWPELSTEVRTQISPWVRQYKSQLQYVTASGHSDESVELAKWYLSQIKTVLIVGRALPTDDIPF